MRRNLLLGISLSTALISYGAYAQEFGPPIKSSVVVTTQDHRLVGGAPAKKEVVLMNLNLTDQQKQMLKQYQPSKNSLTEKKSSMPPSFSVDLKGTPVLDQGKHGSCVTFAMAGAIDSILGKGDYVSPLCSLMLGKYLEERSYYPSGWDGSSAPIVLNQMLQYGIVSRTIEKTSGCAGVTSYPTEDENIPEGSFKDINEYKQLSQNLNEIPHLLLWEPVITLSQRFSIDPTKPYQPDVALNELKHTLATRIYGIDTRVTLGMIVPYKHCSTGACATKAKPYDTWSLSDEIVEDEKPDFAGHEVLVIGYDDNATAVDDAGKTHKGLLILRNSWGTDVGDQGNYYMTYDYFKHYLLESEKLLYFKSIN